MKRNILFLFLVLGFLLLAETEAKSVKSLKRLKSLIQRRDVEEGGEGGEEEKEEKNGAGKTCLQLWTKDNENTCGFYGKDENTTQKYNEILIKELQAGNYIKCKWNFALEETELLTENEARAVNCYTGALYKDFNTQTSQLGINHPDYKYKGLHYFLMRAYQKLSAQQKKKKYFYRGIPVDIKSCKKGMVTHFDNFGSTSDDLGVAEVFATNPKDETAKGTIFVIYSDDGADINALSQFQDEMEYLFSSCSRFVVESVDDSEGDFTYVFLAEAPEIEEHERELFWSDGIKVGGGAAGVTPGSASRGLVICIISLLVVLLN